MALLVGNVQNGNKSDEYAFHGLKRRSDGTLVYSKVYYSTNETVYLADNSIPYNGVDDANTGTANATPRGDTSELSDRRVPGARAYDGVRFDDIKLTYYLNDNGFLVARYNKDYVYADGQDGNKQNYIE